MVLKSKLDSGDSICDLPSYEFDSTPRRLVIEENAAARVEPIALAIVHGGVVSEYFGGPVWAARMEWGEFGLRGLANFAEHFARRCLIEADWVIFAAHKSDCFQEPQNS